MTVTDIYTVFLVLAFIIQIALFLLYYLVLKYYKYSNIMATKKHYLTEE